MHTAESTIYELYKAWKRQDVDATLAFCGEDVRYIVHRPSGIQGLGGEMLGKVELRRYLSAVCEVWEFDEIVPGIFKREGNEIREFMQFRAIHRRTRQKLEGYKRHIWRVEDGLVAECEEFQDALQIRAFIDMVSNG